MRGKLITLEGTDGSGKGTQAKLLIERLSSEGHEVALYDFPRYGQPSAHFVQEYLRGNYPANATDPYQATFFFAMDRYEAAIGIRKDLAEGKVVISNRYTASSLGHLGGRLPRQQRADYFAWAEELEWNKLLIPRPDRVIMLHVPAAVAQQMAGQKQQPLFNDRTSRDIHEASLQHLVDAEQAYLELCATNPKLYRVIECAQGNDIKSIEAIQELVWRQTESLLAG